MSLWAVVLLAAGLLHSQQDPVPLLFQKGLALKNAGKYVEAVAVFDKVIRLSPDDGEAYNNRGALKFLLRDFPGALADYNRAVYIDGLDPKPLSNRCLLALADGRAAEGLLDCARSTKSAKDYYPGWNAFGYVLFELGKVQNAQEAWDTAAEIAPDAAEPVLGLALAALRLGNKKDCPGLYKDAVALKPVIAQGPDAYEAAEGPLFGAASRLAYEELLRLVAPKKKKRKP